MKTISIKGKDYVPVVERVKEFHKQYPSGSIETEIISNDGNRIIVKATVKIARTILAKNGATGSEANLDLMSVYTGFSQAEWDKGMMGGVALEVAETSAVGRALGFANIGLLDGIASADEMRKVKKQPNEVNDEDSPF